MKITKFTMNEKHIKRNAKHIKKIKNQKVNNAKRYLDKIFIKTHGLTAFNGTFRFYLNCLNYKL